MLSVALAAAAAGFDASKFRNGCDASPFCRTGRPGAAAPPVPFELVAGSLTHADGGMEIVALAQQTSDSGANSTISMHLRASGAAVPVWTARIVGPHNTFRAAALLALPAAPALAVEEVLGSTAGGHVLRAATGEWWSEVELSSVLGIRVHVGRVGHARAPDATPAVEVNSLGLLRVGPASAVGACGAAADRWGGFVDSRPLGCTSVALDIGFPRAHAAFGLPERAAPLVLPATMREVAGASVGGQGGATGRARLAPLYVSAPLIARTAAILTTPTTARNL